MVFITLLLGLIGVVLGAHQSDLNGRIAGGNEVDISKYPYALQLHYIDKLECGGFLVTERFALTAGHCVFDKTMENFYVYAGATAYGEGGQYLTIVDVIYHPQFSILNNIYDAAMIRLSEPVSVASASPVPTQQLAADDGAVVEGATVIVAGWGWVELNNNYEYSTTLRETDLVIISDKACENAYDKPPRTDINFCTNYTGEVVKDFCYGDYGGAALIDGVVEGIISWGESCADGHNAQVYLKISKIRDWVLSTAGLN